MLPRMISWLKRLIADPRTIGAIAPSSSALAKLMANAIDPQGQVLELGPGTGSITRGLMRRLPNPHEQLTLVEMDPFMAKTCRQHFPDVQLIEGDALKILQQTTTQYDAIVSGIPFAALPKKMRHPLFLEIAKHLKPGGTFVMFQYSLLTRRELNDYFDQVTTKYTPFNLPPAFVFVAKRKTNKRS